MKQSINGRHETILDRKTILVCGGMGFIGSNFIRSILFRFPSVCVINFDKLTYAGNPANLEDVSENPNYIFIKGDILNWRSLEEIFKKHTPDFVVNFAAETHVDRSIHESAEIFLQSNTLGVLRILELIRTYPVKKYIQISTDEVYGSLPLDSNALFSEISPLAPNSPYAASKAAADLLCRSFFKTHEIPIIVTRCSNNYGPYQSPEKFIPFSIGRLMNGKSITLYGDGKNVRDWIHVSDHTSAIIQTLQYGTPGEVYNIGSYEEIDNKTLALNLASHFNKGKEAITFINDRPGHDRRYAINASKAMEELQWQPIHSFQKDLAEVVGWYQKNPQWVSDAWARMGQPNSHISQ